MRTNRTSGHAAASGAWRTGARSPTRRPHAPQNDAPGRSAAPQDAQAGGGGGGGKPTSIGYGAGRPALAVCLTLNAAAMALDRAMITATLTYTPRISDSGSLMA